MIITDTTMFVIPDLSSLGYFSGFAVNLEIGSPKISCLFEKGFERSTICEAFRGLFSKIPSEIVSREIPQEKKWWQFYKSKSKTVYEEKNLIFKLRVLNYINKDEPLENDDIEKIKALYNTLSPNIREVIPLDFFGHVNRR